MPNIPIKSLFKIQVQRLKDETTRPNADTTGETKRLLSKPMAAFTQHRQLQHRWLGLVCGLVLCLTTNLLPATITTSQAFSTANAYDWTPLLRISRDRPILDALAWLSETPYAATVTRLKRNNARVIFKDLRTLDKAVANFDAVSWLSAKGDWVVFINVTHQNAPPMALAALIAHESMHDDVENSLAEEVAGWRQEATVWQYARRVYPAMAALKASTAVPENTIKSINHTKSKKSAVDTLESAGGSMLVARLERIRQALESNTLESLVRGNPGYTGLKETSVGFEHP